MDIKTLKLFIDAVRNKSINRAAQENYLSASSVSRAIKNLEEETKTKLMVRDFSGVTLTKQGKEFFGMAEPIVQSMKRLEQMYCTRESRNDIVRLAVCIHQNSVGYQAGLDFYERYAKEKEYIDITLTGCLSMKEAINTMQNHVYMLGTVQYNSTLREEAHELLAQNNMIILHENKRKVYVSMREGHPLAGKEIVSAEDLLPFTHVAYIDEEVVPLNYGGDLTGFNNSLNKKRILIRERGQLDETLRATDAYFLGTGAKNIKILENSGIVCIPVDVDMWVMTAVVCRKDYIMTESAQRYYDILMELFERTE